MIHRAPFGSLERFIGILIEHFAGAFPVWLSPLQAVVIPVADGHNDYALQVANQLKGLGIRARADLEKGRMNKKIRVHRELRVPYMLIVGDKDIEAKTVSVRLRTDEDLGAMPLDQFAALAQQIIADKSLELR